MPNHPSLGRRGIIALVLLFASALAHAAPAVTGMQLLSEKRVSRTVFDYTYRITIQNDTIVRQDVVAHLATAGKGTSIVDGDVSVGRLAPNQQVSPDDTVTLRQDRLVPFDQAALTWTFSGHDVIPVGILVPGDPSALLINAMPDYQAPNLFAPPNEVEVDLNYGANKVIRTALNIVFREDATVGDANAFLNSFNGRIQVSMSGGEAVGVGIPDPGSVPALDALIGILERHPAVVMVLPDYAISLSSIPKTANINSVPEPANSSSDYWGLMHHLTVHAAAAWNARSALTYTTSSRPVFVIADFFYSGEPSPTATQIKWERDPIIPPPGVFNCSLDIDAEHCAHGYHVTGIAFANYGGVNEPDRSVTGMYPSTAGQDTELKGYKLDIAGIPQLKLVEDPVKFVAAQIAGILQRIRTQMELKEQQLRNQSPSTDVTLGKIVLNTSFGYPNPLEVLDSVELARYWKHLLQNNDTKYNIKLVDRVFHSAAAGNSKFRALLSNGWSAAALYNNNDIPDFPLVTNTLVVENRMAYFPPLPFSSTHRLFSTSCLYPESNIYGNISAIGNLTDGQSFYGILSFGPPLSPRLDPTAIQEGGTSMAAPQVAGLAAYLWTLRPNLTGSQVAQIIKVHGREPDICNDGSHVIDAYATILSADTGFGADEHPARSAILDVLNEPPLVGDPALDLVFGDCAIKSPHVVAFGDCEVAAFLANLMKPNAGKVADYSRYDLNGDGFTGGARMARFNLDMDYDPVTMESIYGTVHAVIEGEDVPFDENNVSDLDVLCYYAYREHFFTGTDDGRDDLKKLCRFPFFHVNPKGTWLNIDTQNGYVTRDPQTREVLHVTHDVKVAPTEIALSSLPANADNRTILRLMAAGTVSYSVGSLPISPHQVIGRFVDLNGNTVPPASTSSAGLSQSNGNTPSPQWVTPIVTIPTCTESIPTDVPDDFLIPDGGGYVVVPVNAVAIQFSLQDCFFNDNSDPNGNFGVRIQVRPN